MKFDQERAQVAGVAESVGRGLNWALIYEGRSL